MDMYDLINQLETIACNIDNVKLVYRHPFVLIVEEQLKGAIKMANDLAEKGATE